MSGSTREMRHTEDGRPEWKGPWVEGDYEDVIEGGCSGRRAEGVSVNRTDVLVK